MTVPFRHPQKEFHVELDPSGQKGGTKTSSNKGIKVLVIGICIFLIFYGIVGLVAGNKRVPSNSQTAEPSFFSKTRQVTVTFSCSPGYTYCPVTNLCYKVFNEELSFTDALGVCINNNGLLPSVLNAKVNDFLSNLYKKTSTKSPAFWLGFYRIVNHWFYFDGCSLKFSNWASGMPLPDTVDRYAMLDTGAGGKWKNVGPNEKRPFICETFPVFSDSE